MKNSKEKPAPTVQAIVTDIEGTTSSLSFVKDVLFPYARAHIGEFVKRRAPDPAVQTLLDEVVELAGHPLSQDQIIAQLIDWIDQDKKITPLKSLQGLIWEDGYRRGDFAGHIYDDVVYALRAWHQMNIKLYVYSSGSIHAQKLLFGHTAYGDLNHLFSGYYDTTLGHKREATSYQKIVDDLGFPAQRILFLSDIVEELDAARTAGMKTRWLVRMDNPTSVTSSHLIAHSFAEIDPEQA